MKTTRRTFAASLGLGLLELHSTAHANEPVYPSKPITIIYPYASGSASDALTRQVGEYISKALGQPAHLQSEIQAG